MSLSQNEFGTLLLLHVPSISFYSRKNVNETCSWKYSVFHLKAEFSSPKPRCTFPSRLFPVVLLLFVPVVLFCLFVCSVLWVFVEGWW